MRCLISDLAIRIHGFEMTNQFERTPSDPRDIKHNRYKTLIIRL